MTTALEDIQGLIREHVASEIVCRPLRDQGTRFGCVTPMQYANGDSIVVWVEQFGHRFRVSDYGEAFIDERTRTKRDHTDLMAHARIACLEFGVEVADGALVEQADSRSLGDAVWRMATAASVVAQIATGFRRSSRRKRDDDMFSHEVEHELRGRALDVRRDVRLEGGSGHQYRATLYVPDADAILEPVEAPGHFNQVSSVYTKFGDLARANGYTRLTLVDDRQNSLDDDLASLLVQVSDVVRWTRREEWISGLR